VEAPAKVQWCQHICVGNTARPHPVWSKAASCANSTRRFLPRKTAVCRQFDNGSLLLKHQSHDVPVVLLQVAVVGQCHSLVQTNIQTGYQRTSNKQTCNMQHSSDIFFVRIEKISFTNIK
jgi:hypothetical protein